MGNVGGSVGAVDGFVGQIAGARVGGVGAPVGKSPCPGWQGRELPWTWLITRSVVSTMPHVVDTPENR